MKTITDTLKYVAKTGGVKIESKGDTWLNPSKDTTKSILDNLEDIKKWVGKSVIISMVDETTFAGIGLNGTSGETEQRDETQDFKEADKLLSSEHIINISGKQFVTFTGLLDVAHKIGLKSIETELVTSDYTNNIFVFKAKVTTQSGTYESYGDATSSNVSGLVKAHILRMAETRAIARALRWATNVGLCSLEELGDNEAGGKENGSKTLEGDNSSPTITTIKANE